MDDYVYHWADGTYCFREDLDEYLTFMSDDYDVTLSYEFFEEDQEEIE